MSTEIPHRNTAPGTAARTYRQRALAVRDSASELRTYAELVIRDLDDGRVPAVRGAMDAALKMARDIEVMNALAVLPATPDDAA